MKQSIAYLFLWTFKNWNLVTSLSELTFTFFNFQDPVTKIELTIFFYLWNIYYNQQNQEINVGLMEGFIYFKQLCS